MESRKFRLAELASVKEFYKRSVDRVQNQIEDLAGPADLADFIASSDADLLADLHESDCGFKRTQCFRGTVFIDYASDRYGTKFWYKSRKDKLRIRMGRYRYAGSGSEHFHPRNLLEMPEAWADGRMPPIWKDVAIYGVVCATMECNRIRSLVEDFPNGDGRYAALKASGLSPAGIMMLLLYSIRDRRI